MNQHVIVFMKDQPTVVPLGSADARLRAAAITASHEPVLGEMAKVHATHVLSYQLINAFAATVSTGEAARLKANPRCSG